MVDVATERIVKTPGTCGGKARIAGSRVRVMDIVVWYEYLGWTADEIVDQIPTITLSDVHSALAYYYDHIDEIRDDIRRNTETAERYRPQHPSLLEEKLRARRHPVPSR